MTKPTTDLSVRNEGSIFLLRPQTQAGEAWITEHIPDDAQRWRRRRGRAPVHQRHRCRRARRRSQRGVHLMIAARKGGSPMTAAQFARARDRLGLTQAAAGQLLGSDERTVRRWELGERKINPQAALLVTLLLTGKLTADDLTQAGS
jgi:DNA-binding transcriptional regulator YiaG